ncbi:tyrosine-type recombinase/integrase [Planomonospora parontospora]|uniref:tyrosine-type recombinase/integrase n=1 Tax=Planomonospora parontospora TaxID=58119 RepID=UPI00166FC198|nr:site-specific integrase [Planomonospora parontospora]GGL22871.1 site-specific integrase [Planomonospora parontospora subsp. antibiotica]GII14959.1 site-specific integrase [Planomonospora parontospora subsp. antibiotica]
MSGKKRRGQNEDSIYKDGDRWRGALSLGYGPDGNRIRKKVSGKTRAEVVEKIRKIREGITKGLPVPDDKITVGAFLDRWLSMLPGHIADSTLDDYEDTVRLHLKPGLGRHKLTALTVAHVDALWQAKREKYKPNSVRNMRAVLRKALGQAEREGLVGRNVAALSMPPRVNNDEGRTLTVTQARKLLDQVNGHRMGTLVLLALVFGLRRGEALGLMWDAFDSDAGTLRVTHAVKRLKNRAPRAERRTRLVISELKTKRSRRTLCLTPELVDVLKRHRAAHNAERLQAGQEWAEHGLIFPTAFGSPSDPDNFSRLFSRLSQKAGLGHWHPHELRHSGASLMLAQGTPLHVVSEILGHASIAITKDVYGHLVEGDKRAATTAISGALLGGQTPVAPRVAPSDAEDTG